MLTALGPLLEHARLAVPLLLRADEFAWALLLLAEAAAMIMLGLEHHGAHEGRWVVAARPPVHRHAAGDPLTAVYPERPYVAAYVAREARRAVAT